MLGTWLVWFLKRRMANRGRKKKAQNGNISYKDKSLAYMIISYTSKSAGHITLSPPLKAN